MSTQEDLQAFQAKHFPSQSQHTPTFQDTYYEPDFAEEEEDDLGCYPDGVKRTLTDEQVRIFRHSEIHSLLRERDLKAENEALSDSPADKHTSDEKRNDGEDTSADQETGVSKLGVAGDSTVKQERRHDQPNGNSESGSLDYGEDGLGQNNQQPKNTASSGSAFTGRRIISYAD